MNFDHIITLTYHFGNVEVRSIRLVRINDVKKKTSHLKKKMIALCKLTVSPNVPQIKTLVRPEIKN